MPRSVVVAAQRRHLHSPAPFRCGTGVRAVQVYRVLRGTATLTKPTAPCQAVGTGPCAARSAAAGMPEVQIPLRRLATNRSSPPCSASATTWPSSSGSLSEPYTTAPAMAFFGAQWRSSKRSGGDTLLTLRRLLAQLIPAAARRLFSTELRAQLEALPSERSGDPRNAVEIPRSLRDESSEGQKVRDRRVADIERWAARKHPEKLLLQLREVKKLKILEQVRVLAEHPPDTVVSGQCERRAASQSILQRTPSPTRSSRREGRAQSREETE